MQVEHEALRDLQPYLMAGEQLRWAGKPQKGFYWSFKDGVFLAVGLVFMAFASGMSVVMLSIKDPIAYVALLMPAIFFGVGFWAAFIRKIQEDRNLGRTSYGITNHGVLLLVGGREQVLKRLAFSELRDLELTQYLRHGTGTIRLQPDITTRVRSSIPNPSTAERYRDDVKEGPRLERILDAPEVYQLLLQART